MCIRDREYKLTSKGVELAPILVALAQWGDKHAPLPHGPVTRIVERDTGQELAPVTLRSASGQVLMPHQIAVVEGPGASAQDKARLAKIRTQRH